MPEKLESDSFEMDIRLVAQGPTLRYTMRKFWPRWMPRHFFGTWLQSLFYESKPEVASPGDEKYWEMQRKHGLPDNLESYIKNG